MRFSESLADLKNHVGSRNSLILSVAIRGIGEGMTPESVAEAFESADCGDPPLNKLEVSRAISRAKEYLSGEKSSSSVQFRVSMRRMSKIREGTSPEERGFVRRMIGIGRSSIPEGSEPLTQLALSSPVKIFGVGGRSEPSTRLYMARSYVNAIYGIKDDVRVFATDNINAPRELSRVFSPKSLVAWLENEAARFYLGDEKKVIDSPYKNNVIHYSPMETFSSEVQHRFPTHICANEISGENVPLRKCGSVSYANKGTISSYSNALVEFDAMDVGTQALFWKGVTMSDELDVLAITHSGGKSLHGIIRVNSVSCGDDLFGNVTKEARQQKWAREWEKIARVCCSDEDAKYRCDAACKDPVRMTRFPGGLRVNRDTINEQLLVYCKK